MQEQTNEYNPGQETEQPNDQDQTGGNQNVVTETETETGNTATETDVTTHHTQYEPPAAEVDSTGTDDNNDGA